MAMANIIHFFTTIFTWKNILTQITLSLLIPLSFIFAAHTFFPNILNNNPHHLFTFIFTHSIQDLLIFTILFFHSSNNNNNNNNNTNPTFRDVTRTLVRRLILTFMYVYFLSILGDNLMVAILHLTDTIVFTIFFLWCVIITTYALALLFLLFVVQIAMIRTRGAVVGVDAVLLKVVNGLYVNLLLLSPLIRTVGEGLTLEWTVMSGRIISVMFLPLFLLNIVLFQIMFDRV